MNRVFRGVLLLFAATRLEAQKQPMIVDSCIYRIPAKSLTRVPVFLQATADSSVKVVLPGADLFAQSVAFQIRDMLGAAGPHLPEADSAIQWSRLWGEVIVTFHRDAKPTWRVPAWSSRADTVPRSSIRLLFRSIDQVVASGEIVPYPDGFTDDSISFSLSLVNPTVTKQGKIIPVVSRQPIPVFSIAIAWEKNAELINSPRIEYPTFSRRIGSVGGVRLLYTVKKNGQVDPDSFVEQWPESVPRLRGDLLKSYEAFLRAAKEGVRSSKFSPAMVGGCPLNQVVQHWFEFKIR